jgi:two-component system LytT family sensor kinase
MKMRYNDFWIRLIGIPLVAFIGMVITNFEELVIKQIISIYTLYYFLALAAFICLIWNSNRYIHYRLCKYYEQFNDRKKFAKGWLVRLICYGVITISIALFGAIIFKTEETSFSVFLLTFFQTSAFALLCSYMIAGFYETNYFIYEWGNSFTEMQELKRLNLQIQIDSLKSQLNPHFLFNSLNTLSSLVMSDQVNAAKFIDEMSTTYRYLLQNNEKDLITLMDELKFITAFFHLLKTRYAEAIRMETDVNAIYLSYCLPPLTLQLLVENAVKHNVVSLNRPLTIKIYTNKFQQLVVENNVQKKTTTVKSNKIGLTNIFSKYILLNQPPLIINHTESIFQVILPLMPPLTLSRLNN